MLHTQPMALSAATPVEGTGGSSPAYSFLEIPTSTRLYGLGGMNITVADPTDVFTIDQNPALLGPEFDKQLGINYMRWMGGSNFAGVRYAMAAGERAAWSAAIQYFGYGSQKETDSNGNVIGEFSPMDLAINGAYSRDLSDLVRGAFNIKMAYSSYSDFTAIALAADLGLSYYDPDRDLSLSIVAANLGGQVKRFNDTYDRLPIDLRLGWAKSFGTLPIRFSLTAYDLTRWEVPYYDNGDGTTGAQPELKSTFMSNLMRHIVIGADFIPSEKFNISLGYNYRTRTDMSTYSRSILSGFSIGASLRLSSFGVGVALAQPHSGATTMMVNFTTDLNELLR
ncbi:MAG: type IX secretion system protein PorQ [Pseudoflavonifractor sp.]|nr:type IX secretion system protein PorQ [Alloprevotella sp.]MCM1117045.1 type IX secretion system protein PorQ [Pseudoflavonifractor sp.]